MRKFYFEFLEILFAVIAGAIGAIADYFGIGIAIYLPISFGFLIASSALLLKREISAQIDEKFEIYQRLSRISDHKSRDIALKTIEKCKSDLKDIEKGELKLEREEFYRYIINSVDSAKKHVAAIHVALDEQGMFIWKKDPAIMKYYQANKRAVKRGVTIERIFVLKRELLISFQNRELNQNIVEVMQEQINDGIAVEIKLIDSPDDMIREFMIYDGDEVQTNFIRLEGKYHGLHVNRNKAVVEEHKQYFERLKPSSQSLDEILKEFDQSNIHKNINA